MFQMKEQDKNPRTTTKWSSNNQSTQERVESNNGKDDPRTWEKNDVQSEKLQEVFSKELESIKNNQTESKNTITAMKNTLEGINSRINEAEERISELEDRVVEIIGMEQNKEERIKWVQFKKPLGQCQTHQHLQ